MTVRYVIIRYNGEKIRKNIVQTVRRNVMKEKNGQYLKKSDNAKITALKLTGKMPIVTVI